MDQTPRPAARRPGVLPTGALAGTAVALATAELLRPGWTPVLGPAGLAAATGVVGLLLVRRSRRLDPAAAATWRAVALIAVLLGLGQLIRALTGAGLNPTGSGLPDLPLAASAPVAVLACVRMVRSGGGRVRVRFPVVLDAVVALTGLGALLEVLVPVATARAAGSDLLLTVGYPAVGALLCAAGLVTLSAVSAPRRPAAGWLLLAFAALDVVVDSGALAQGLSSPVFDVLTSTAYLLVLGAMSTALAADPGPGPRDSSTDVPLTGVVVSYCVAFGVVLVFFGSWAAGRPVAALEALTVAVLMLLTFVRTLVWAADGARLTRQVVRTEAWFRALVHRSADFTVVLDAQGQITWTSLQDPSPGAWTARELEGRPLRDLVHDDDHAELARALDPLGDADPVNGPCLRFRTRAGTWRQLETIRTASTPLAGLRAGDAGAEAGGGVVLHLREVTARRRSERELERMAYTDYLTGLPNRARLMAALEAARGRVAEGEPGSILLVDLDGFKAVNDVAGHEAGDRLLCEVATALRDGARDQDLVARLGGDEFALVVPGTAAEAAALADRLVRVLDRSFRVRSDDRDGEEVGPVFAVSGSIGLAELQAHEDVATAIRSADLALRAAKAAGKNRVRSAGPSGRGLVDEAMRRRGRLARDLPRAIERGQLELVYQPVVGIAERRVLGLEALVRWQHPQLGTVAPDEFIPLAEEDGLIVELQRWVLGSATAALSPLLAEGRDLQLGVNVSVRHLQAGCLAPDVIRALTDAGVPPQRLMLEITESVLMTADDGMEGDLAALRELGCVLSLDDFGKGYSSLARLARLPVDVLKMDRAFVANIERDPRTAALVASVIDLGRTLGMDVVAEGVETRGQVEVLARLGCRFLQGYLLGIPVSAASLPAVIDGFDPTVLDVPPGGTADPTDTTDTVHLVGRPG